VRVALRAPRRGCSKLRQKLCKLAARHAGAQRGSSGESARQRKASQLNGVKYLAG